MTPLLANICFCCEAPDNILVLVGAAIPVTVLGRTKTVTLYPHMTPASHDGGKHDICLKKRLPFLCPVILEGYGMDIIIISVFIYYLLNRHYSS